MANNRLYIACLECSGLMFLGKYYPSNWEVGSWTSDFETKLNDFLREHAHAHSQDGMYGEREGHAPFVLITENDLPDELAQAKRSILDALSGKREKDE